MRTAPKKWTFTSFFLLASLTVLCLVHAPAVRAQDGWSAAPPAGQSYPAYDPRPRHSDPRSFLAMSYSMAFASGDLHSFIGDMSPRGFDFSPMILLGHGAYLGLSVGFNRFYEEEPMQTYARSNADVTGTVYRSATNVGLSATGRYYFLEPGQIARPYAGLRLGIAFWNVWNAVADFSDHTSPMGFLMVPEAGVALRISRPLSALVGYQYNFSTASFTHVDRASYHALQVGLQISY